MTTSAMRLFASFVFVVLLAFGVLVGGGLGIILQVRNQARANQRHVDCIISTFSHTNPPFCRPIVAQLERDGVLPAP